MPALSIPHNLVAGRPENINDVQDNFEAVESVVNGLDGANFVPGVFASWQRVSNMYSQIDNKPAGLYYFQESDGPHVSFTDPGFPGLAPAIVVIGNDYSLPGRTTRMRLRIAAATNGTNPNITLTFGLYPFAGVTGGIGSYQAWLQNPVVPGSTKALTVNAANGEFTSFSSSFAPPATGIYGYGVSLPSSTAAAVRIKVFLSLQVAYI